MRDQAVDTVPGRFQSLGFLFIANSNPFDAHELDIGDADERKRGTQVRFLEIHCGGRAVFDVQAAATGGDDANAEPGRGSWW
jgi:hypothetical protein